MLAAKAGGKPTGSKAITTSTPAWKAKLQARTPTSKDLGVADSDRSATPAPAESSTHDDASNASRDASMSSEQQAAGKAVEAAEAALKLTFIAPVPLLPKPDLTRYAAPSYPSSGTSTRPSAVLVP